jgi:hypothetical protein
MLHTGIPLDENAQCRDKAQIRKAITSLRAWCEEITKQKAEKKFDPDAYLLGLKEWVHEGVFQLSHRNRYNRQLQKRRSPIAIDAEEIGVTKS